MLYLQIFLLISYRLLCNFYTFVSPLSFLFYVLSNCKILFLLMIYTFVFYVYSFRAKFYILNSCFYVYSFIYNFSLCQFLFFFFYPMHFFNYIHTIFLPFFFSLLFTSSYFCVYFFLAAQFQFRL